MATTLGFLVLHGFAGTIDDVLPLVQFLRNQGYTVECPTLEGHGADRDHLKRSTRGQWIHSAEQAYQRLSMRVDITVVIGFSMGGLLAFHLATHYPVGILFTLCTPYYYWDVRQSLSHLKEDFSTYSNKYLSSLFRIPLSSMMQFRLLLAETKLIMHRITCPYYIIQGKRDDTVQAISAEYLQQKVTSKQTTVQYFPNSGHLILQGPESQKVISYINHVLQQELPDLYGKTTVLF
ncbi:alpha/beta fold hydrolase [Brevibacillus laterosporus]|uniref:Alpha/beta fold hydrolase n=1 Tax=Brevibacillus laterosporus TaxID=1465 RepID=A0A502IFP4_BRELA|nr:alpha/beta fold hydrolase [Brevibacillus laterosporus]QDX91437.1 alpha/beta fold hydrolase [Brevibacillus laterosporus]RAP28366.1 Carboxylesterase [Brevibacillus laterosporus]TPG69809.1 alpha/beta fold hydrolase [Brevibacillus laterosporus]TPG84994.1 alpha/beta fold hydrolase [Brevibacillus laterosporus]